MKAFIKPSHGAIGPAKAFRRASRRGSGSVLLPGGGVLALPDPFPVRAGRRRPRCLNPVRRQGGQCPWPCRMWTSLLS
jgi:hypothetical protein